MKYTFILLALLFTILVDAQDEKEYKTIFGGGEMGGYGSFSAGYTHIDSLAAISFSARGGVILGHTLAMGIGGSGFITEYEYQPLFSKDASISGGYGGVFAELILVGKSPVHISIPVLAGIGGVAYSTWENAGTDYGRVNYVEDVSTFLIFEPGIELEFNLTKYFRLAGYFNYRYTSDIDLSVTNTSGEQVQLLAPDALNSYTAGVIFKFGKF